MISRRNFLRYSALSSVIPLVGGCDQPDRWRAEAFRKKPRSHVAILEALRYDISLSEIIAKGVKLCGLEVRGKKIILKPNLVEFDPKGVINTNPLLIEAAIDCFLTLGARKVLVAEGPGHRRDNDYLLTASGIYEVLKEHGVAYVDLNSDDVRPMRLRSSFTRLEQLYLPETLYSADLLVSMPKLKTHHWAGVTLSMKNMFGVVPSSVYGWPKNVLHWQGIHNSILDINSSLPVRQFAIVDGIVGMEGNGPLQGQTKDGGMLIFGEDLVAVDATAARLMKIEPKKIKYLAEAGEFLGNVNNEKIEQIGEKLERMQKDFRVIEEFQDLKVLMS
jgi:uncharacterized protein (DUF362 family)